MRLYSILLILSICFVFISCDRLGNNQNNINEQGMFMFPGEPGDDDDFAALPSNVNPETVLCFGKGFKVGRCINKEMEKGICMGLLLHGGSVIAVEIPCETITRDSIQ